MANEMILNTIKTTDTESRKRLFNALNNAESLADYEKKQGDKAWPIMVTDIVIVPATRAVSGDACENVYLICEDDVVYFTQSNGIAKAAKGLAAIFEFDSKTAIPLRVVTMQNSRNGNTIKSLEIVE